jgi:hypothetical protein
MKTRRDVKFISTHSNDCGDGKEKSERVESEARNN